MQKKWDQGLLKMYLQNMFTNYYLIYKNSIDIK